MSNVHATISARVDAILADLDRLLRAGAIAAARAVIGAAGPRRTPTPAKPPSAVTTSAQKAKRARASKTTKTTAPSSAKPDDAAMKFLAYVRAHPGERGEIVCKKLRISTNSFRHVLNQWLAAGVLTKRGNKRATRYWAGTTRV